MAWLSSFPAKTVDLAVVVAISYTVEVSDAAKGSDYFKKAPSKRVADSGRVAEYVKRATRKRLADAGKGVDAVKRQPLKKLTDSAKSNDYLRKLTQKKISDSTEAADYFGLTTTFIRSVLDLGKAADLFSKYASLHLSFYDVGEGVDYVKKGVSKRLADLYRAADYAEKTPSKVLVDFAKGADYVKRLPLRSVLDTIRGADYVRREVLKKLVDSLSSTDLLTKTAYFVRAMVDAGEISDYVKPSASLHISIYDRFVGECLIIPAKGKLVSVVDAAALADYICKLALRSFADASKVADVVSRLPTKVAADVGLVGDFFSKGVGVSVLDRVFGEHAPAKDVSAAIREVVGVLEALILGIPIHVDVFDTIFSLDFSARDFAKRAFEAVVVRDAPYRLVTLIIRDWLVGEYLAPKEVSKVWREESLVSEVVRKDIGKRAVESIAVSEAVFKDIAKRIVESVNVIDVARKTSLKIYEDKAKTVEIVAKVGFKLAGYDVRRVYFLPKEFQVWWDIIESQDHNTKLEICKALIQAFKRVRDKIMEG